MDKELKIMVDGKEVSPELAEKIQELISRSGSHNDKCGCGDCKKISKIKKFRGFCKGIGDLFVSTEPLKTEEVSEAEAEEIEDEKTEVDANAKKTEDEVEVEKAEDEAKKADADADAKKTDAGDEKTDAGDEADTKKAKKGNKIPLGALKGSEKTSKYVEIFYIAGSGRLISKKDLERLKKLPVGKNPISIEVVKSYTVSLEGGLSCTVEKVPAKAEEREFLHVRSKTLISKSDAELYKAYCTEDTKDDPVARVLKIYACLVDEYGLEKTVDINNF